jgi:hypothetical protein
MKSMMMVPALALFVMSFVNPDLLTGRWQSPPSPTGSVMSVMFKPDNSFESFINKKPFAGGKYTLKDDIFTFSDNACDGRTGIYKIVLFSNADSLRFVPILDSCTERANGMSRLVLGKIK